MDNIKVSVCIVTYNQENYIRQCLDSVFMQKTNFDFEVIVGEDKSPDNTREILLEYKEKYGDKLILILHDENVGLSRNSQSIQLKVRGKYVAFVEGDDFWTDENKLQKQYDILEAHPEYSAVCHDIMNVNPDGTVRNKSNLNLKKDIVKTMKNWLNEGYSVHTCSVFRRNIFPVRDEKYIKFRTAHPTMGDVKTFTLLYDAGGIYVIKDVMAAHRAVGKSDVFSYTYAEKKKAIEHTYMYIDIVRSIEEYLDYKYDLSPLICNRISFVKFAKLTRNKSYDSKEMKKLMKTLPLKIRFFSYVKLIKRIFKVILKKLRFGNAR